STVTAASARSPPSWTRRRRASTRMPTRRPAPGGRGAVPVGARPVAGRAPTDRSGRVPADAPAGRLPAGRIVDRRHGVRRLPGRIVQLAVDDVQPAAVPGEGGGQVEGTGSRRRMPSAGAASFPSRAGAGGPGAEVTA